MVSLRGVFELRGLTGAALGTALLVAGSAAKAAQDNLWSHEFPGDKPVLIDSIGNIETTILVQVQTGRPLKWVPQAELLVHFAGHGSDDVLAMQPLKDGAPLGKPIVCPASAFVKEGPLVYFNCGPGKNKKFGRTEIGSFGLKVSYRQTLLGQEHELATLGFDVVAIKHGSKNKPTRNYADNLDMKLGVATLEESGNSLPGATSSGKPTLGKIHSAIGSAMDQAESVPFATFRFWLKSDETWSRPKMSCLYKGKKVAESRPGSGTSRNYWSHGESGRIKVRWDQMAFRLSDLKFRPPNDGAKPSYARPVHWMNENPGDYRCVVTAGGEVVKEVHFTIGADGTLVRPACQAKSMKSLRHVTLVRQVNKGIATIPYDEALARKSAYQGNVTWQGDCPLIQ